ncbi:MAG: glycosyltransferase family 9 protein, partial [bacterium]
ILKDDLPLRKPFMVVHPGHSNSANHLNPSQYRSMIEFLHGTMDILLTGKGDQEHEINQSLAKGLDHVYALGHNVSLLVFSAVLQSANVFMGGSSGPIHLASLVQTPQIGFYSNDPRYCPEKWRPLGSNQLILTPDSERKLENFQFSRHMDKIKKFVLESSK